MENNKSNVLITATKFFKESYNSFFDSNNKYISWGVDNKKPFDLLKYYETIPEHSSSIKFTRDLTLGKGLNIDTLDYWLVKKIILDFIILGGFAIEITKNRGGELIYKYKDISKCRINKDKTKVGYCEDFSNYKLEFEWFNLSDGKVPGIYMYCGSETRETYPVSEYESALIALSTMNSISIHHNSNAKSGFSPNVLINFNNGTPSVEIQNKIEDSIKEKFTGENGQKFIISFNDSTETAATVTSLQTDNLDEKFETLQKFIQNQIIIGHRLTSGTLIGVKPENQGFSKTEYEEALSIFKETVISSIRKELVYVFNQLLNVDFIEFIDESSVDSTDSGKQIADSTQEIEDISVNK